MTDDSVFAQTLFGRIPLFVIEALWISAMHSPSQDVREYSSHALDALGYEFTEKVCAMLFPVTDDLTDEERATMRSTFTNADAVRISLEWAMLPKNPERAFMTWTCPRCGLRKFYATRRCGSCSRKGIDVEPVKWDAVEWRHG